MIHRVYQGTSGGSRGLRDVIACLRSIRGYYERFQRFQVVWFLGRFGRVLRSEVWRVSKRFRASQRAFEGISARFRVVLGALMKIHGGS